MRSMPWFRFYSETADDRKFSVMARALQMSKHALIGIWAVLECRASQSPRRGYLLVTFLKRYTIDDLADDVGMEPQTFSMVMDEFIEMGMVDVQDGVFHLSNWEKRQYSSDNSTKRVEKYREKQQMKQDCNVSETFHVTVDSASVSDSVSAFKEESIVNLNSGKITKVLMNAAGLSAIPPSETERIGQLTRMIEVYGENAVEDAIRTAVTDWVNTRGKSGRYYSKINMGWVDRAQNALDNGTARELLTPSKTGMVDL